MIYKPCLSPTIHLRCIHPSEQSYADMEGETSETNFKSGVDERYTKNLNLGGKLGGTVQVILASYSSVYYYLQEQAKYETKKGEEETTNIMTMRVGVYAKDGKLLLEKGFNRRTSINFYKSSRHAPMMKEFFDKCIPGKPSTITIWDRPDAQKESGYILLNFNCGICSEAELEQLSRFKNEDGTQIDYLIIESSAKPTITGMTVNRSAKQTMLFARDIENFKKWYSFAN